MIAHQLSSLTRLNSMAQRIAEPAVYGTFADDAHYLAALDILLAATDETDNRIKFFMNQVVPKVQHHHLLDIGIGDGVLSKMLGIRFRKMTLVDNSKQALESVSGADFSENTRVLKIQKSITEVELTRDEYDLAVLSHTLYYLDSTQWLPTIQKIFSSLKPNGMLVIVLNGGLDKDRLAMDFGGKTIDVENLARDCSNYLELDAIQLLYERAIFQTQTLLPMLHIANLHLYDVGGKASKAEISSFLKSRQNNLNQLYQFSIYQKYILMRKRIV